MTIREVYKQADKIRDRHCRIEFLKRHRDQYRPRSKPYKELHAEVVRQMMAQVKIEIRAA